MHQRRHSQRTRDEIKNSILWVRAHFLLMIDEPAEPNTARRVAGCQLALEKDIIGSRGEDWAFEAHDKVYAQDGFLEHFRWCEQAQLAPVEIEW